MSHTTTYQQIIKNVGRFCNVAKKRGHEVIMAEDGQFITVEHYKSYLNSKVNAVEDAVASVHLQEWRYPLAIKQNGEIMYDHFGSAPHTLAELGLCMQEYNKIEILDNLPIDQIQDYSIQNLDNGDLKLVVNY